jgi:transketolase
MNDNEIIKKVITENIDLETLAGTSRVKKALMEALSLNESEIKKENEELKWENRNLERMLHNTNQTMKVIKKGQLKMLEEYRKEMEKITDNGIDEAYLLGKKEILSKLKKEIEKRIKEMEKERNYLLKETGGYSVSANRHMISEKNELKKILKILENIGRNING